MSSCRCEEGSWRPHGAYALSNYLHAPIESAAQIFFPSVHLAPLKMAPVRLEYCSEACFRVAFVKSAFVKKKEKFIRLEHS